MKQLFQMMGDLCFLSRPYFSSEDRKKAWLLIMAVLGLTLLMVGLDVWQSFSRNIYYTALQQKDLSTFLRGLFWYSHTSEGFVPGFFLIAIPALLAGVYATYLQQLLQLRWRTWMTRSMSQQWLHQNTAFLIAMQAANMDIGADNPDQRIQEDIDRFAADTLTQFTSLFSNLITLVSYIGLLWVLSGPLVIFGLRIPGYFLWVALIYSIIATIITHFCGRKLINLQTQQQKVEADFRYALVHIRNHAASIALTGGSKREQGALTSRFTAVYDNFFLIMKRSKWLGLLTSGLEVLSGNFALLVGSVRYFAGKISFGTLMQLVLAFSRVQGALGWIASSYSSLAEWRANVIRLAMFQRMMARAREYEQTIERQTIPDLSDMILQNVDVFKPDSSILLQNVSLTLPHGQSIALAGPSGIGKSTLLRVMANIWPFASGCIQQPQLRMMFMPQRPYLPLGNLKQILCYPLEAENYDDTVLQQILRQIGLPQLAPRLKEEEVWEQTLSPGEQQRLMFGRILLNKPDWVFLDEATSNLDEAAENTLYAHLRQSLPNITIVSVTHKPSLQAQHNLVIDITRFKGA